MAIKLKQYLENSWYRWASQDRQTWYAAQFQYWEWINIRDIKNWVCLAAAPVVVFSITSEFIFFEYDANLYCLDKLWDILDSSWTILLTIPSFIPNQMNAQQFWDYVFVIAWWSVYQIDIVTLTVTDRTPTWFWWWTCMLNFANTYLLIWDWEKLWRIDLTLWTPVFKKIREFQSWYAIRWLTQEWNYLKIYTTNWEDTKIHYAKGTFDVEDTWLIQTISFKWLAMLSQNCITSDEWNDYALFQTEETPWSFWEYKLSKITWYSKIDIRWTQRYEWQRIFQSVKKPEVIANDWVVFANMDEWIRTFTEYNWWLRWWCVEFPSKWYEFHNIYKFDSKLYVCMYDSESELYSCVHYDLSFQPRVYQYDWFIIGRVFDWWCAWLFKKNDQATITYHMPNDTKMELSYRYDRSSFRYDKSNFRQIKELTDTNSCYDIVVPTTPSALPESLLQLEDNYDILLEDWTWILLEDIMVCPFNRPRNLLEYRFDLHTDSPTKTPILFEHSLTYYDYMRKYR